MIHVVIFCVAILVIVLAIVNLVGLACGWWTE